MSDSDSTRPAEAAIEEAFRKIIRAIGEDPQREGLRETPTRIARMYQELFQGTTVDPRGVLKVEFREDYHGLVTLGDISFYSMCEHHFLPFFGVAHVGYLANGRVVGISKLARLVEILSRRAQLQERLTNQIADALNDSLHPSGVGVVVEAHHLCLEMRGIQKPGARMVTTTWRGDLAAEPVQRAFLEAVRASRV
ncbi:MAG TPA: GTP cyclohydrolase I FolE [Chloroflexota bacterium]|nr:GTP cyclohydrolase I FolE [Chloroflexota bacterium]